MKIILEPLGWALYGDGGAVREINEIGWTINKEDQLRWSTKVIN